MGQTQNPKPQKIKTQKKTRQLTATGPLLLLVHSPFALPAFSIMRF